MTFSHTLMTVSKLLAPMQPYDKSPWPIYMLCWWEKAKMNSTTKTLTEGLLIGHLATTPNAKAKQPTFKTSTFTSLATWEPNIATVLFIKVMGAKSRFKSQ